MQLICVICGATLIRLLPRKMIQSGGGGHPPPPKCHEVRCHSTKGGAQETVQATTQQCPQTHQVRLVTDHVIMRWQQERPEGERRLKTSHDHRKSSTKQDLSRAKCDTEVVRINLETSVLIQGPERTFNTNLHLCIFSDGCIHNS